MKYLKYLDPFYLVLAFIVMRCFKQCDMHAEERLFIEDNIAKHRKALWINIVSTACVYWGLLSIPKESAETLILALLGPVMVFGGAWFAITFGGIPSRLLDIAMTITFWMFTAFLLSVSAMFIAVAFISPPQIWFVLAIVFWSGYVSCVQYDATDGLKVGLDEAVLKHSRAALRFYKEKHAISPDQEKV